jgi:replicative DNA helicase
MTDFPATVPNDMAVPNDMDAEQCLLGCWLSDPKGKWFITANVPSDDFYYDEHVLVAKTIADMVGAGMNIDPVTVNSRLKAEGKLDRVGAAYVKKLGELSFVTANAGYYAATVRDLAHIRSMIRAARDTYELGLSAKPDAREMQSLLANALVTKESGHDQSSAEVCGELLSSLVNGKDRQNVPTSGLRGLDDMLHGFFPGTMYTVSARMSVGKSALLSWIALQAARQKYPTAFVSLEMKPQILAWRMVSCMSGVNASKYFTNDLTEEEWARVMKADQRLSELPIRFISTHKTVDDVCLTIRRAKITANIAVAGVDYLQMLHDSGHAESRTSELDGISTKLKSLAEELDIALICVVAVNRRSVTEKGGVSVADMRGSDGIAYDADCCIILNEEDDKSGLPEDVSRVKVSVAKNRNGKQGEATVFFDKRYQRWADEVPNG